MNVIGAIRAWVCAIVTPGFILSAAADLPLSPGATVSFANAEASRHILTNRDEFIIALTAADRSARMKTARDIAEEEFLAFLSTNAMAWTPGETNLMAALVRKAANKLAPWRLPFPPTILLVKTSGREEFGFSYTRQNAVLIPARELESAARPGAENGLIHELFHVLSRANPELRTRLYAAIGFRRINELGLPRDFRNRTITNPDGCQNGWTICLTNNGRPVRVVPVLYELDGRFNLTGPGANPMRYFRWLVVEQTQGLWQPVVSGQNPVLLRFGETTGFYDQAGRNTDYVIHPDEILADNFVRLMNRETNLPSPQVAAAIEAVLRSSARRAEP